MKKRDGEERHRKETTFKTELQEALQHYLGHQSLLCKNLQERLNFPSLKQMKTTGPTKRIKPKFTQKVLVPEELQSWAWDAVDRSILLETLVYRVLSSSSSYEAVSLVYSLWPEACKYVVEAYDDVFRGCRSFVQEWEKNSERPRLLT